MLYGTRVSLILAPAAALLSTLLAALVGGTAGYLGGKWERTVTTGIDLFLSLPWLFLLLTVRALLPLNTSPLTSVVITFLLLGCLGWAGAARVICADARALSQADFILLARASGSSGFRLLWRHLMPNLKPILYAQFWISVPNAPSVIRMRLAASASNRSRALISLPSSPRTCSGVHCAAFPPAADFAERWTSILVN